MPWKYIGDGSFCPGLPARDLADDGEDAEAIARYEAREGVSIADTKLYERVEVKKGEKPPKEEE